MLLQHPKAFFKMSDLQEVRLDIPRTHKSEDEKSSSFDNSSAGESTAFVQSKCLTFKTKTRSPIIYTLGTWIIFTICIGLAIHITESLDYDTTKGGALSYVKYAFLLNCIYLAFNLFSLFPYNLNMSPETFHFGDEKIIFRFVTRGTNEVIHKSIRKLFNLLESCVQKNGTNLLEFCSIDVVSDVTIKNKLFEHPAVNSIVVPKSYKPVGKDGTPTKYKARALQYAIDNCPKSEEDKKTWIVHLDEETFVPKETVKEICYFISTEDKTKPRIAQGAIRYSGNYEYVGWVQLIITLLDSLRATDDLGKFRLQFYVFGMALIGMKGSFVVWRQDVMRAVGFNNGTKGSITEDAYTALMAAAMGYVFAFLSGWMEERSPFTVMDLLRQRERWIRGLWFTSGAREIALKNRLTLGLMVILWGVSMFMWPLFAISLVTKNSIVVELEYVINCMLACYVFVYCNGFWLSFDIMPCRGSMALGFLRYIGMFLLQILVIIPSSILEALSLWYALYKSLRRCFKNEEHDFHVVNKDDPVV